MTRATVAYIIGSLATGGAETQLLELLRNLDRSRFRAALVLLDCTYATRAAGLVESIYDLKVPSRPYVNRRAKAMAAAAGTMRLSAYLRRTRPKIVQSILPHANIFAAAALALTRTSLLIGCRRSLAASYRLTKPLAFADRTASRRCNFMLGNSDAIVKELVEVDGIPANRVARIYNGVDVKRFRPGNRAARQKYKWAAEHFVIGVVANFFPYKRHIDFIHAAELIANSNSNARFLMAGQDSRGILGSLNEEIRSRGMERLFTIIPGTSHPEELYPALDLYLCPSQTEGLSNVLLEAGACGLPIVATRVGGNPEVVVDGHTGILVEPCAPESMAAAVLRLAADPQTMRRMGNRSRERIAAEFSIDSMVGAHMALYDRLLKQTEVAPSQLAATDGLAT
jgi:glycosyltransferase involved in cell wall biosynthesis